MKGVPWLPQYKELMERSSIDLMCELHKKMVNELPSSALEAKEGAQNQVVQDAQVGCDGARQQGRAEGG